MNDELEKLRRLFEAANVHVTEQGHYCNQLIGTINNLGAQVGKLKEDNDRLLRELDAARAALAACEKTQDAMRRAVYGAGESL